MALISFSPPPSPPPGGLVLEGLIYSAPRQGKRGSKEGWQAGWHTHLGSPSLLHPLSTPSPASSFASKTFSPQAPQAFYFTVIDGEQVPIAGIMHSKLPFCLFLIGQSPWGFTQPSPRLVGEGAGAGRDCECRCLVSCRRRGTIAGVTLRPDIAQKLPEGRRLD